MADRKTLSSAEPTAREAELLARVAQLEARLAMLEDVLAHQSNWICRFRPDGTLTYVNHAYARDLQTPPEQLIGRTFFDFIPPADRAGAMAHLASLGPERLEASYEHRVQLPDGRVRWDQWTDRVVLDDRMQVVEIQSVGHDITARRLAQEQLIAQRDLAQALAGTASLDVALQICLDIAIKVSQMDSGGFYLVEPETGDLNLVFSRNLSESFVARTSHWPAESDRTQLVMQGRPCYRPYAMVASQIVEPSEALRSAAVLPLCHHGQVIGCLNLGSYTHDDVPLEARSALEAIAAQVGQAIVRVQIEEALRSSQQVWQSLFDSLQDFLFVLAEDGTILRVNQMVLQRLGYREEELLGQPVLMVHPPDQHAEALAIIADMVAGRRTVCPLALLTRSGRQIPVETKVTCGRWGNQDVLFGVSRDVTDHLRIEAALRESEARLRAVVHHFPNGAVFLFDHDLRYLVADGHELSGDRLSSGTVEGRTLWQVLPADVAVQLEPIYRSALSGRSPSEVQLAISDSWYHLHAVPIRDEVGAVIAGLIIALNITEQKRAQLTLSEQTQAMATLRERERVARELHDSLGQVLAYINVQAQAIRDNLSSGRLAKADAALASLIAVVQENQLEVREFILAARAQRPAAALAPEMDSFIPALDRHLGWLARAYDFHTELRIADGVGAAVLSPLVGVQLLRIVQEALTNIRRHAGVRRAAIAAWVAGDQLALEVSDAGRGFDPSIADRSLADPAAMGYGLQSMRERAEELGGTLVITTAPGEGTTLRLDVPLRPLPEHDSAELRVLLVDDSPLFLQGLWQLLQSRGFVVVGAVGDGRTALEWARAFHPDVVLMDVAMPGMSGIEAMRAILTELPSIHVVMLTAAEDELTLFEALQAGAAGYLLKSMDAEDLCAQLWGLPRGETALSANLALRVLRELAVQPADERLPPDDLSVSLTPQQVKVLTLLAQGHTYKAIAQMLDYSERAIKYHTGDAIKKLQLKSRADAIAYARQQMQRGLWPSLSDSDLG